MGLHAVRLVKVESSSSGNTPEKVQRGAGGRETCRVQIINPIPMGCKSNVKSVSVFLLIQKAIWIYKF